MRLNLGGLVFRLAAGNGLAVDLAGPLPVRAVKLRWVSVTSTGRGPTSSVALGEGSGHDVPDVSDPGWRGGETIQNTSHGSSMESICPTQLPRTGGLTSGPCCSFCGLVNASRASRRSAAVRGLRPLVGPWFPGVSPYRSTPCTGADITGRGTRRTQRPGCRSVICW